MSKHPKGKKLTPEDLVKLGWFGGGGADVVIESLTKSYSPIPGPTRALLDTVRDIAKQVLQITGTRTVGIVGICTTSTGRTYLGFSPDLQAAVLAHEKTIGVRTGCRLALGVDDRILEKVELNKGCAEKKLMSAMLADEGSITNVAVAEYPLGSDPGLLASHMGLGSAKERYYVPCETCRAAYANYLKAKKGE